MGGGRRRNQPAGFQGFLAGAILQPPASSLHPHLVCREVPGMPTAHFDVIEDRSGFSGDCMTDE